MSNVGAGSFLPVIELAVSPMILLTAVGGFMITLTNRMGRIVDRTRELAADVGRTAGEERAHFESQLQIMWRRARLIRRAVTYAGLSMLLSCLLVVVIFVDAWFERTLSVLMMIFFAGSIFCLVAALVSFLRDIFVSLHALGLEIERARGGPGVEVRR